MYHKTVLKNGVRIISEPIPHLRSVSLGIWVNAGSRDEAPPENGISHFIEHMIFKGTARRDAFRIAKELDAIGGMSNAFTGKEHTCFHAKVLDRHFDRLADILSDIFLNSTFDDREMERERQVILQEISMVEDSPDDKIHVLFNRGFWRDHPIGRSILGTGETVSAITREAIRDYMGRFYVPERVLVAAAGNVDHRSMVAFFEPLFESAFPSGRSAPPRKTPGVRPGASFHFKELEQVHLCLGGEAPSQKDEKRFACAAFNTLLGGNMSSRLFQEVREKRGLAYSVYSFVSSYADTGLLGVYLATDLGNVNLALEVVSGEIRKMIRGAVSPSDLEEAKEYLIGGLYLSSENSDSRMMRTAKNEFIYGRYIPFEELVSRLEKVTVDDVVAVARDVFRKDRVSLTTLGPVSEADVDRSCLVFDAW